MLLTSNLKFFLYALFASLVAGQTTSVDYCVALEGVINICEASTSGWLNLPASQQASCACGTALGTIPWGPATYDQLASACASQYATIDATIASDARGLEGFCTAYVAQGMSTVASTPARTSPAISTSQPQQTAQLTVTSQPQQTGLATPMTSQSQQTGLFTSMTPTTVISVETVAASSPSSPSSSKNAAGPIRNAQNQALGFLLPFLGMLMGAA